MLENDDLDSLLTGQTSERERVKMEHEYMHKAASHPVRRQLVRQIGVFGATKDEIKGSIDIDEKSFKYHTEFLINGDLLNLLEGKYFLTEKGLEMLSNIK
jgi:predicted transcriptional regulator